MRIRSLLFVKVVHAPSFAMFDTEKFIYSIEKLTPLYDVKSSDYSNRQLKAKCWNEVGEAMYENWNEMTPTEKDRRGKELMKRWKTLRDNFVRDFRLIKKNETGVPATKKKKYIFYDQLSFLLPHIKGCENTASNITPPEEQPFVSDTSENRQENNEAIATLQHLGNPGTSSSAKERERRQERARKRPAVGTALASATKSITSIMQESLQLQKAGLDQELDKFGNKAFLLSFVPTMNNLPPALAFDVRMKITEVFKNAVGNTYTLPFNQEPRRNSGASTSSTWVSSDTPHEMNDPDCNPETPPTASTDYNNVDEDTELDSLPFKISDFMQLQ